MPKATDHPKVFLSYRSADRPAVEEFAARLRRDGVDAWYDHWEIVPGDDIVAKMDQGIDGCTAGLIFVSPVWFDREWTQDRASVSLLVDGQLSAHETRCPGAGRAAPTQPGTGGVRGAAPAGGLGAAARCGRSGEQLLAERGWVCSATTGTWSLDTACAALRADLLAASHHWAQELHKLVGCLARRRRRPAAVP